MSKHESIPQAPSLAKILLATVVAFIVAAEEFSFRKTGSI